jgi:hypothetical protein
MYTDFKFFESTVPYIDFIGLNRFNFTLFPFFIKFHIIEVYFDKNRSIKPISQKFNKKQDICSIC